jgi:hypothetical protein
MTDDLSLKENPFFVLRGPLGGTVVNPWIRISTMPSQPPPRFATMTESALGSIFRDAVS